MRGFSMGGAACWQFAVHYPSIVGRRRAGRRVLPRRADFLKVFQNETVQPTWYEQKLWHLYDCTDYALQPLQLSRPWPTAARGQAEAGRRHDGQAP